MAVYLIHFDKPLHHARHYIGYAEDYNVAKRLEHHRAGRGARLLAVLNALGIGYQIVRTWPHAGKHFERHLKNMKKTSKFCPVCNPVSAYKNMKG